MYYLHIIERFDVIEIPCTDNIEHDFFTYLNATEWGFPAGEFLQIAFHYSDNKTLDCVTAEYADGILKILPITNRRNVWTALYQSHKGARL